MIYTLYQKYLLQYPKRILLILLVSILSFSYYATKLEIDASAETLLLDNDQDLKFARTIEKRFQNDNILILTYKPQQDDLLSPQSLLTIKEISSELEALPQIKSVTSILTVPLLFSPTLELSSLANNIRTLSDSSPDMNLVKQEFLTSPLYKNSLVSSDFKTTAILITLKPDELFSALNEQRNQLKSKENLTSKEKTELKSLKIAFKNHRDSQRAISSKNIEDIRSIITKYQNNATLFLGGIQMISNDVVSFVESDLLVYGSALILLLIIILGVIFKELKWIVIPISICVLSVVAIASILGYFSWEITVISSNFIALQLIITISIILHLIVRYEEYLALYPKASHKRIILATMLSKTTATIFAILTTIAGFSSLMYSSIYPIINLGWMMSAGIIMSLIITFVFFPALLILLKKKPAKEKPSLRFSIPMLSNRIVLHDRFLIFIVTALIIFFGITGGQKLIVENSFINYFKKDTAIYQGMKVIDEELGGTTPLDIIVTFNKEENQVSAIQTTPDQEDSFEDEFESSDNDEQYWFTDTKMNLIKEVHRYLETLKETGDVKSFATLLETGKRLDNNKDLDSIKLGLLYQEIPEKYKEIVLAPYINIEKNQARFTVRIIDSKEGLRRNELLQRITKDLSTIVDPTVASFKLTNLMVLYNNMLQSLFESQIATLGIVLLILTITFLLLFRSIKLASISMLVNMIPIGAIFGFMGWFGIPLDIMTITIAAIAIGIGVDNTIHYLQHFKKIFSKNHDYVSAIRITSSSVGNAMYYTSLSIIVGFSILVLSNLVPTIYFGLLTILAMLISLISNLLLLPKLLLLVKPIKID